MVVIGFKNDIHNELARLCGNSNEAGEEASAKCSDSAKGRTDAGSSTWTAFKCSDSANGRTDAGDCSVGTAKCSDCAHSGTETGKSAAECSDSVTVDVDAGNRAVEPL